MSPSSSTRHRLARLFRCGSNAKKSSRSEFHPDRPPPEPYPGPLPVATAATAAAAATAPPQSSSPAAAMDRDSKSKHTSSTSKSFEFQPPAHPPPPKQNGLASSSRPSAYSHPSDDPPPPFAALPDQDDLDLDLDVPPPAFLELHEKSPASNAPEVLANAGWAFTDTNPLAAPLHLPSSALATLASGAIALAPPPLRFSGLITSPHPGIATIATAPNCPDTTILSALPLYVAGYHHPLNTHTRHRAFFDVTIHDLPDDSTATIAIGFCAVPYPPFRLPGWNRGSLGIHSDDGRRYTNDSYGGRDFVSPWKVGQTVGVEMTWDVRQGGGVDVEVGFWRDGVREDGWKLDEERDGAHELDTIAGLGGGWDVYAAVGVWGGDIRATVKFESGVVGATAKKSWAG